MHFENLRAPTYAPKQFSLTHLNSRHVYYFVTPHLYQGHNYIHAVQTHDVASVATTNLVTRHALR